MVAKIDTLSFKKIQGGYYMTLIFKEFEKTTYTMRSFYFF